jgi:DNA polymerase I-like protein with 3'-5' exonuclease and polymerase domains
MKTIYTPIVSTGRLSVSKPNLQNIPIKKTELGRKIIKAFVSNKK